jgi:hypothetical protein
VSGSERTNRRFPNLRLVRGRAIADLEIGDTAGLETCATTLVASLKRVKAVSEFNSFAIVSSASLLLPRRSC